MKDINYVVGILFIPFYSIFSQTKSPDKFVEFKNVWVTDNKENPIPFKGNKTDMKLHFNAVFDKNSILSFYMNLEYTCHCTPTLERKNEAQHINKTGSHLYYTADYVYTEYSFKLPKKEVMSKKVPVELWVNRVNHEVGLKIDNKSIIKQLTYFSQSLSINSLLQKYGTLPLATSIH